MAELVVQAIQKSGLDQSATGVAADIAGDTVKAASGIFFHVVNADAGSRVVTIAAPVASVSCGGFGSLPVDDIVHTILAGEELSFTIPLGYSDASNNFALAYDAVAATTVGVYSLA